jgi:GH15 family glucan-1,4-alpha-glucosidase
MHIPTQGQRSSTKPLLHWLIRKVRVIRGEVPFKMECYPAFNYAQDKHTTRTVHEEISDDEQTIVSLEARIYPEQDLHYYTGRDRVIFESENLSMDLRHLVKCGEFECPFVKIVTDNENKAHLGPGVWAEFDLKETQEVVFVFREVPATTGSLENENAIDRKLRLAADPPLTMSLLEALFRQTSTYWLDWISQSTYKGRWREHVFRSALTLKLLTYEPVSFILC